jgi:LDH2 family malate/lactate/ureidoglycolate dehydrogenase
MPDEHARAQGVSMFLLAIDPAAADGVFPARIDELIDQMHASPVAPGVERVTVPGERGNALAAARRRDGVPLPTELVATLKELANELGVPGP